MSRAGDRHFDEFQGHTRLKHLILKNYLEAWGAKLCQWHSEVWFVDAFAGEGRDQAGNPGSPLIAADVAERFDQMGNGAIRIIAFEKNPERYRRLKEAMRPYRERKLAYVACDTLANRIDGVVRFIGERPTLYFLDPFGVRGLFAELFPKLLSQPRNEVLALFSDVGANRLHAVLMAPGRDPDAAEARVLESPSLFEEMTHEDARRARMNEESKDRSQRGTQVAAQKIFAESLPPGAIEELAAISDPDERRQRMVTLFMEQLLEAGAAHAVALPMRGEKNQRTYQLVYASKSATGLRTMKEAMESALRSAVLPERSVEAIRVELRGNEDSVVAELAHRFAGREVRWTEGKDRGNTDTVRRYLLERTAIFPMQFDAVKNRLDAADFVLTRRPLTYRFPPAPPPMQ